MSQIRLQFPFVGLHEGTGYTDQPKLTTPSCVNVLAHDPRTGRRRGGSRSGSSKFCPDQINGSAPVQNINHVVQQLAWEPILLEDGSPILLEDGSTLITEGSATIDAGERRIVIVGVAGGTARILTRDGAEDITNGSLALSQTRQVIQSVSFQGNLFYADGETSKYYDSSANEMKDWTTLRTAAITSASNTTPVVVTTPDFHGLLTGDEITIAGASVGALNTTWTISFLTTTTFELNGSVASGASVGGDFTVQRGTLPIDEDGNRPTIISLWAGRILFAGVKGSPYTLFATAVEDPFNVEYSPVVPNVQQAFAGNTPDSTMGNNPDIITGLIPYNDDTLIILGDTSIHVLRGNPVEGGRIDLVSSITGGAFGTAWCKTPEGLVYFQGSRGGIYRMSPSGGEPQRLTANTIDDRLSRIDYSKNAINLVWDDQHVGVRLFITPFDGSGLATSDAMQYFYDARTEAWFPFCFGNASHNPRAIHLFDGPDPNDRVVMLGGLDGYVRYFNREAIDDDGQAIVSSVLIGPLQNVLVLELQIRLSKDSANVTWEILEADVLDDAVEAAPSASGTFHSGNNPSHWPRRHVASGYVRLAASEAWALEELMATVEADTEHRRRVF